MKLFHRKPKPPAPFMHWQRCDTCGGVISIPGVLFNREFWTETVVWNIAILEHCLGDASSHSHMVREAA